VKVSIIITCYNYGRYLERCLRSCLDQNFPKDQYEVLVIDDCSEDETAGIMENYRSIPGIRYVRNKKNLGVAGAANEGIKLARGQYVVRVDADDYVSKNFILILSMYMQYNPDAFCVACDYIYVNNDGEKLERVYASEKAISCGIMYRKDELVKYGMYNDKWRHREEEEMRKRIGKDYAVHYLRIPLYRYLMHDSNKTKQIDKMEEFRRKLLEMERVERQHIHIESAPDKRPVLDYVVAVIPARGSSERLKRKNIYPIWGKPMIYWAIQAARKSKYVHDVFVSTEDEEIREVSEKCGAIVIDRPHKLSEGNVYKQDVICHATRVITERHRQPTLVVSLQANSPQVEAKHIDQGIKHLVKYNKNEVMSVDKNLNQNAAIRIMKYNTVFQESLSGHFGVFVADLCDVHLKEDVDLLEKKKRKG